MAYQIFEMYDLDRVEFHICSDINIIKALQKLIELLHFNRLRVTIFQKAEKTNMLCIIILTINTTCL